jgi:hypothetical protein
VLPPFDALKAENYSEKTENDRSFTVKMQKKSRKYVFDIKLFLTLCQYDNENFSHRILILLYKIKKKY